VAYFSALVANFANVATVTLKGWLLPYREG
jgi:hypothetical protein